MRYWLIFLILGVFLSGCGGSGGTTPELPSLNLLGFEPSAGPPGRPIKINCSGVSAGLANLYLEIGKIKIPVIAQGDDSALFFVPFMTPADYSVKLECNGQISNFLPFAVQSPRALPYSKNEFALIFSSGLIKAGNCTHNLVKITDQVFNYYSDGEMMGFNTLFANLDKVYADLYNQILALEPEQAAMFQSFLYETGALALIGSLDKVANDYSYRETNAITVPHHILYKSDVTSMLIKNLNVALDAATITALVLSEGSAAPILTLTVEAKVALGITSWILDTLIPTDLFKIDLVINKSPLYVGDVTYPNITGHFRCEDSVAEGTLDMQLNIAFDALFSTVPKPKIAKDKIKQAVVKKLAEIGIDKGSYLLGKFMEGRDGPFVADFATGLDMKLYRFDLGDVLAFAFPALPIDNVVSYLETIGFVPPTIADSVAVTNPSLLSYNYSTGALQCLDAGKTQIQALGFRMEEKSLWIFSYKFLTFVQPSVLNVEVKAGFGNVSGVWKGYWKNNYSPKIDGSYTLTIVHEGTKITGVAELTKYDFPKQWVKYGIEGTLSSTELNYRETFASGNGSWCESLDYTFPYSSGATVLDGTYDCNICGSHEGICHLEKQ